MATDVRGARYSGIQPTLKHFPGLGCTRSNTDTSADTVDGVTTADDPFLQPFAAGIAARAPAVMVSSARYLRLDAAHPAVFSSAVIGMLCHRWVFTGMVVSDDLGAAGAVASVPAGQRAVWFVQAGGDLVLTVLQGDLLPRRDALVAQARGSAAYRARLDDAVIHVLRAKYSSGVLSCSTSSSVRPGAVTVSALHGCLPPR